MGKNKKRPSPEESENEVFHVEVLMAARVVAADSDSDADVGEKKKKKDKSKKDKGREQPSAQWEYFVKWAGYDSDANSWEPEANVAECQRLLKSFWAEFEDHERDYAVGDVIEPSKKWIKKEKKFFMREFSDAQEKLRLEAERAERERTKKATKKRSRKSEPGEPMGAYAFPKKQKIFLSDAEDEEALPTLRIVVPAKRKHPPVPAESSEDDRPLSSQVHPKKIMKTGESSRAVTNPTKEPQPKKPTPPIPRRPQVPLPLPSVPQKAGNTAVVNTSKNTADKPVLPQWRSNTSTPVIPQKVPSSLVEKGKQKTLEQPSHEPDEPSLFSAPSSPVEVPSNVPPRRPLPLPKPPMKTTPTIPPKIPRRMTNPHIKLGMAPEAMASGSGLSTKQRLAQGALAPTLPKAVAPAAAKARPTLPPVKTASLMPNLSFKKNPKTPVLSANASGSGSMGNLAADQAQAQGMRASQVSPDRNKPTLAALNMRPSSPGSASGSPAPGILDMPLAASPQEYTPQEPEAMFSNPFAGSAASPLTSMGPPAPAMTAAEKFLAEIMPAALAAPLTPAPDQPVEPRPPPHIVPTNAVPKALALSKIPKKWKWTGKLYFEGEDKPICNVTMCDATVHFSSFMDHWDRITFPSFHDVADVSTILLACKPPTHIARLAPASMEDNGPMTTLSVHLVKHQKVIFVPVKLDNDVIGHILLFHHVMGQFIHRFKIPSEVQEWRSLVAVFLPWVLSKKSRELQWRKPPTDYLPAKIKFESMVPDKSRWAQLVRTKPLYQHALRILKFPKKLHEFMSQEKHHRTYGLCPETNMRKGRRGPETAMLVSIMEQCRAKLKSPTDSRVVFVHISAIKSVLKHTSLLNQRKENLVQFYVYGSHYSISPEYWGFNEIYQCGGVVTFTPLAIDQDPIGVKKKIKEIHQHPFWACYILPTALGMTVKLEAGSADPVDLFQKGELICGFLPKAVTKGRLSLMCAPPDWTGKSKEKNLAWAAEIYSRSPQTIQKILETTLNSFKAKYANTPEPQQLFKINSEICLDLVSMQHQLAIMTRYRRYVVIRAPGEVQPSYTPGLEWATTQDFGFGDDFIV